MTVASQPFTANMALFRFTVILNGKDTMVTSVMGIPPQMGAQKPALLSFAAFVSSVQMLTLKKKRLGSINKN